MLIVIPTRGRAARQVTWRQLPSSVRTRTVLLVDESEREAYIRHIGDEHEQNVRALPSDITGIGKVRQHACDLAAQGNGKVLMMDDDLRFYKRRDDDRGLFQKAELADLERMFAAIEDALDTHALVGIGSREGGNRYKDATYQDVRILRLLAYRADTMAEHNIRFDRVPVMEDFDVALQLLRRGHHNKVLNDWVHNQEGSGREGGCATYRTREVQDQAARKLAELHPGLVRVVTKVTKESFGGGERTDVVVSWKKAFTPTC